MTKGLKINNTNSSVKAPEKPSVKLEEKAQEVLDREQDYKKRMLDISSQFKSIMEDQTLQENKGPIVQNVEREVLDKLYSLAADMNADDMQPEGIGSNTLCMLLFRAILMQRNKINDLSYKIHKLTTAPKDDK